MRRALEVNYVRKLIDWIKEWSLVLMILLFGAVYLVCSGNWRVYAKPFPYLEKVWEKAVSLVSRDKAEEGGADAPPSPTDGGWNAVSGGDRAQEDSAGETAAPSSGAGGDAEAEGQTGESPADGASAEPVTRRNPEDVAYVSVEDDYFSDAVFIGDSRTVGLKEYAGLEETAAFYASTGLSVHKLFSEPIVEAEGRKEKETVEQALSENSFSKIYLMIGINEMGTGTVDTFMEDYEKAVEHLRELQPDAILYLQAIMKVTAERSNRGDYITNEGIEERNARIAELADNVTVYYLDVNPLICDETGGMDSSYTYDGVHLKAQYVSIWKDFLKTHAIDNFALD